MFCLVRFFSGLDDHSSAKHQTPAGDLTVDQQTSVDRSYASAVLTGLPSDPRLQCLAEYVREIRDGNSKGPEDMNTPASAETYASVLRGGRSGTEPNWSSTTVVSSGGSEHMTDCSTQFGSTRCDSIPFNNSTQDGFINTGHVDRGGYADIGQDESLTKYTDTLQRSVSEVDYDRPLLRNGNQGQSRVKNVQYGLLHSEKTSCSEAEKSKKRADKFEASDANSCVRTSGLGRDETTDEPTSLSEFDGPESQSRVCNGTNNGQSQSVDTCTKTGSEVNTCTNTGSSGTGSEVVEINEPVDSLSHKEKESVNKSGKAADPTLVQWCPVSPR